MADIARAEARVVRTALRCNRLGAEHPGFWPAYFAMENACAALERIRKGGKKR